MPPYIGRSESPLVDNVLRKKQNVQNARTSHSWAALNLILAFITYMEIKYRSIADYLQLQHPIFWYTECGLAVLFTVNVLVDVFRYISPSLFPSVIELTNTQKRLLGVTNSDIGFKAVTPKRASLSSPSPSLVFSPSIFSHSPTAHSPSSHSSSPSASLTTTPSPITHVTPPTGSISPASYLTSNLGLQSRSFTGYASPATPGYSGLLAGGHTGVTQGYLSGISPSILNQSSPSVMALNTSHHSAASFSRVAGGSPFTPNLSPLFRENLDTSGLRSRFHNVSARNSPVMASDDCMTSMDELNSFLKEQEEKEMKNHLGSVETSPGGSPSFWNFNRSTADYTPVLRKYQYQIACRSPQSTKSRRDDDPEDFATYRSDEVWNRVNVHREDLDKWIENLRKWLSQTIFVRLVNEINMINKELARLGCEGAVGEVSIGEVKQLAMTKGLHIPSLNAVVPFLEVCANQEYLVQRIRELGQGGCMAEFRWNKGGDHKGKPWAEHLPTDSALLMHMLCTYMDSRLPPHPKYPDGKTFTSQHFIKTPDKPNLTKKDNLCILQSRINPPNYKVVIGDDLWELPKGRSNLFQAILLFLHQIKTKEHGMLGRVNLGLSGINVLWVIENS